MQVFFILGREPKLSAAEITAVYGHQISKFHVTKPQILIAEVESADFQGYAATLGGSVKYGPIEYVRFDSPEHLMELLGNRVVKYFQEKSPAGGKIQFALNSYGNLDAKRVGLAVKGFLHKKGHSVRLAVSRDTTMSAAATTKNGLLGRGVDLVVLVDGASAWIGYTAAVQPFEEQSERDFGRPARDSERGMLPPQLTRLLVNLVGGCGLKGLLDPFCGVGTVLMEAALLGVTKLYGSDIDAKAIHASGDNLNWLWKKYQLPEPFAEHVTLAVRDARQLADQPTVQAIVSEPFLGAPATQPFSENEIKQRHLALGTLYKEFLRSAEKILAVGGKMALTLPACKLKNRFLPFPKENLLPTGLKFIPLPGPLADTSPMIYSRADQLVGREIVLIEKI